MNKPLDELILVDLFDREIGSAEKMDAHQRPVLHRAFSIFLTNADQMLLQRRAAGKYHSGGLWANSCCSHPRVGETLERAAHRRLREELGMDCPLREIGSFIYCHEFSPELFEYEYDHIFLGTWAGAVTPDPEEIAQVRWISFAELETQLARTPLQFAVWFRTAAPMVLRYLKDHGPLSR